jgi:hypothetical protein
VAADAVAARAHRDEQVALAGETDRSDDVGDAGAACDAGRAAVDRTVPDRAGLVVAFVFAADHRPVDRVPQSLVVAGRHHRGGFCSHATTVRGRRRGRLDRISNQAVRISNLPLTRG